MTRGARGLLARALAGPLVVVLTFGGCGVGSGEREPQRMAAEQLLAAGVAVDLTDPPSREDLGLRDGETSTVLQREDRASFEATVTFTDGHVLTTTAVTLIVTADAADGPPVSLTLRRDELDRPALEAVLREAVTAHGADLSRADAILDAVTSGDSAGGNVTRVLPTGVAPPDRLTIQTIAPPEPGRVVVHYDVAWG